MAIKCILFDMDNTLLKLDVDWRKLTREVNERYFGGKYSHLLPHQFFVAYYNQLLKKLPAWQQKKAQRYRLRAELAGIPRSVCFPYRGVVKELRKKYKLGIVSGNLKKTVKTALKRCGMLNAFSAFASVDAVEKSKPSPIPIKFALRKLGCKPSQTIFVGDHPGDMRAGKAAGVMTVWVFTKKHRVEIRRTSPDAKIKTLYELPAVLEKLERKAKMKKARMKK